MDATELLIQISSNYPAIAYLLKLLSIVIGGVCLASGVFLILQVEVFQNLPRDKFGTTQQILLFVFSGLFISLGWTLDFVGNTIFDYGGYILESYEGSDDWKVQQGLTTQKAMQQFGILTSRLIGSIFGFWGVLSLVFSVFPNSEQKQWPAWIRVIVGAALFNPVAVLDWFGGWGTKFLT